LPSLVVTFSDSNNPGALPIQLNPSVAGFLCHFVSSKVSTLNSSDSSSTLVHFLSEGVGSSPIKYGLLSEGESLVTITSKLQAVVLPEGSFVVKVFVVVPIGNKDPDERPVVCVVVALMLSVPSGSV